jgi:tRNA (guanine-N1)-methyltransferase
MIFKIITTQPDIYKSFLANGLISRGIEKNIIDIKIHNLHDFAYDSRGTIDDTPCGGGAGMVIKVDVADRAINNVKSLPAGKAGKKSKVKSKTILLTPQGKKFDQDMARKLSKYDELILISGRFEGFDERIRDLVDEEISIGDFVLTSGDLPAMTIIDAVSRQVPGFIERKESIEEESFSEFSAQGRSASGGKIGLEYPQFTRPIIHKNKKVPDVLLNGNHKEIAKWRKDQSIKRTKKRRPDLI